MGKRGHKNHRSLGVAAAALVLSLYFAWAEKPAGRAAGPETIAGRVVRVHDGDTFNMRGDDGRKIKVRLFGIDAPETGQAGGPESGKYLKALVEGRRIRVESRGYDQYGRLLGLVYGENGPSVNHEMAAEGQAWVYDRYCDIDACALFRKAQKEARKARRGLWGGPSRPQPPWEYRVSQRAVSHPAGSW